MFWEILKASKGLPVTDQYAALWGKKIAEGGGWKVTEITGELPLIFLSDGSVLVDYRIYGTLAGAGVETETKIYGWHVDPSISDSANAITYLGDAVGKTPATMGAETFSYGDWSDAFFMPKPCMVKSDGTVDYYLDPNDYSKKADGTASDVANPDYDGNAMMEWPLIWWKYEAGETEGEGYFYVSNRKVDDSFNCWCNYNCDDKIVSHFYTAIYNGTGTSKMRSISGVTLTNANGNGGTTATKEITRATANNTTDKTEWYIDVWSDRMLINGLLILMGKSLNSQAVFGRGLDTDLRTAKEAYVTGTLNDKGLFWGDTSAGTSGVKVFGMENYWGCVWHRTAGLIGLSNGNTAYKLTYGTVDGTTADGYNTDGNGYLVDTTARPEGGYFKTAKFGKFGYLPLTTGGFSTTYYSDYWYTNNSALTFALVGGSANDGAAGGCSYFNLSSVPGNASWNISSSLSFKPLAKATPEPDLTPTDPPVPLPAITAYKGENTLSSTETLGEVTVKGRIKERPIVYGWHVDPSISDPAQAITYLGDAVGKTPAAMGSETFSYGDWENAFFMPKPCMLRYDGTVAYYLDPNDYTKKADGTASDVANASFDGNAMMEWPLIWWKYEAGETEGEGYFYVTNRKVDDSFNCWCNYNCDDKIVSHFYTAIYNGTGTDKMRSISGVTLTNANGNGDTTAAQEIERATANNTTNKTEWYIDVWADRMLINGLLILMGKSLNSQAVFGRGLDTGGQAAKEAYVTGSLNDKGLFWGIIPEGTSGVKVFGMENWWGCVGHRTAGLIGLSNGNTAYKLTYGTADGTTADGYNTDGNGYLVDTTARPEGGWIKAAKFGKFGYLPLTTGGSSTTYFADFWYISDLTLTFALVGGNARYGVHGGCSGFNLNSRPSYAGWVFSSSLSCKPLAKTVPDTDIIPHGYKLPLTVESGEQSQDILIYIGNSKLGEEEYVDFGEQKVYKRTVQLFDKFKALIGYRVTSRGVQQIDSYSCSDYIEIVAGEEYKVSSMPIITNWYFYDNTKTYLSYAEGLTATAPATAKYVRVNISNINGVDTFMLTVSTEFPETYIPYLQPTDPPVPLPPIPTFKGENTLSSTETLGEVTVKGRIKEVNS